jgi:biotin carboxyl carrier protein
MKQTYEYRNRAFAFDLTPSGQLFRVTIGDKTIMVKLIRAEGERFDLLIDGQPTSAYVSHAGAKHWVTINGQTLMLTQAGETRRTGVTGGHPAEELSAKMPGLVRAVLISEGELVKRGQTLAVIEAMKMENKLSAPFDGRVKKLLIKVGQAVEREQVLVELTAAGVGVETGPTPTPGDL